MGTGARLRQLANLLNGSTLLGLLLAAAARCRVASGPRGLILAAGYRWRLPHAAAFTVGNVVLFRADADRVFDAASAPPPSPSSSSPSSSSSPDWAVPDGAGLPWLLGHEERHSTQYALCCGIPFLPLYFAAAGWSLWRAGNPGTANPFERHAGLAAGGYPEHVDARPRVVRRFPGFRDDPISRGLPGRHDGK
ncbi:hypothetical protein ABC337_01590 [Arthrobacter sp. 1P04PC]|uniref:hypothetical protein n=1 Tax=unclassified Arthrobacter TaxID=235627 RepID=UPI0039A24370